MDNDGKFPEDTAVLVRFPRNKAEEQCAREAWPWLPGSILEQVGADEWRVCVEVRELATREDGSKPRKNTPSYKLFYPVCFRSADELRRPA